MDTVALVSGGMDSYVGTLLLERQLKTKINKIYIDYGGKCCAMEKFYVMRQFPDVEIVKAFSFLNGTETGDGAFMYARNLYFALYASRLHKEVVLFGHKNSEFADNTISGRLQMSALLSTLKQDTVTIYSPIEQLEKEEVVDAYIEIICPDISILFMQTLSCTEGKHYCGKCVNCFYFYCALFSHLPQMCDISFYNMDIIEKYYNKLDELSPIRRKTVSAIAAKYGVK